MHSKFKEIFNFTSSKRKKYVYLKGCINFSRKNVFQRECKLSWVPPKSISWNHLTVSFISTFLSKWMSRFEWILSIKHREKIEEVLSHNFCSKIPWIQFIVSTILSRSRKAPSNQIALLFVFTQKSWFLFVLIDFTKYLSNSPLSCHIKIWSIPSAHLMFSRFLLWCQLCFSTFVSAHSAKHRRSSQLLSAHLLRPQTHRRRLHRHWCHSSQHAVLRSRNAKRRFSLSNT